jgi:hypothetical protein
MNKSFLTLETLWLSIRIHDILRPAIFDEAVFQYAKVLQVAFDDLINHLLRLSDVD